MLVMGDGEPWDPGDDMVMDRQDHLPINVDKSNLEEKNDAQDVYQVVTS